MTETKEQQLFFMRRAIRLGWKGRLSAPPNPWVGCVCVKEGKIVGEGYHEAPGRPHAEVVALERAGTAARGCTLYVSLEPCAHQGRTSPCVQAVIQAGVRHVVIPCADPDPHVAGMGIQALEEKGIRVTVGVAREEGERALESYLHHRRTRMPLCVLKAAISLDGRVAAADHTSQWITSEQARRDGHLLRAQSQAVLVGSATARLDQPRLTARLRHVTRQPLRVLIDSQGSVPPEGPLFDPHLAPTLLFTTVPPAWTREGIEVMCRPRVTLRDVLGELGRRGVLQLLVEGGAALHAAFLEQGLAQRCCLYVGNCLLGCSGLPLIPGLKVSTMDAAPRWVLERVRSLGGHSVRLDYRIPSSEEGCCVRTIV